MKKLFKIILIYTLDNFMKNYQKLCPEAEKIRISLSFLKCNNSKKNITPLAFTVFVVVMFLLILCKFHPVFSVQTTQSGFFFTNLFIYTNHERDQYSLAGESTVQYIPDASNMLYKSRQVSSFRQVRKNLMDLNGLNIQICEIFAVLNIFFFLGDQNQNFIENIHFFC